MMNILSHPMVKSSRVPHVASIQKASARFDVYKWPLFTKIDRTTFIQQITPAIKKRVGEEYRSTLQDARSVSHGHRYID